MDQRDVPPLTLRLQWLCLSLQKSWYWVYVLTPRPEVPNPLGVVGSFDSKNFRSFLVGSLKSYLEDVINDREPAIKEGGNLNDHINGYFRLSSCQCPNLPIPKAKFLLRLLFLWFSPVPFSLFGSGRLCEPFYYWKKQN